jgi:hypothetical protein
MNPSYKYRKRQRQYGDMYGTAENVQQEKSGKTYAWRMYGEDRIIKKNPYIHARTHESEHI